MPYPRLFNPSTLCTVGDGQGATSPNCPLQLFRPFLGCNFNGPQPRILGVDIPQFAAGILRGLVAVPNTPPLNIQPGPAYWKNSAPPALTLNEDPNALTWVWMDAIPWDPNGPLTSKIWSFWAAVGYIPPPPPPMPVTMGLSAGTATLISLNQGYISTLAAGTSGYVYSPKPGGVAADWWLYSVSPAGNPNWAGFSGTHMAALALWSQTPASFPPGHISTSAGSWPGTEMTLMLHNNTMAPQTYTYGLI